MRLQNHLYIMRHGQSENNVLGLESCRIETQNKYGLTPLGHQQVQAAANLAPQWDFIYSSPFRRAQETAAIMAHAQGLEVLTENDLCEFKLMDKFDEQPYEEAEVHIHCPNVNLNHQAPPGGESFDDLHARVTTALTKIDQAHTNATILLVSHGSPVEATIQTAKGVNTGFGAFEDLPKNAEIIHLNTLYSIA